MEKIITKLNGICITKELEKVKKRERDRPKQKLFKYLCYKKI